jgi:hypothetical protein
MAGSSNARACYRMLLQERLRLPWPTVLTREELRRGETYYGSGRRLHRLASKLLAGKPIKVYALGGSVTGGGGASLPKLAYVERFFAFIRHAFHHKCAAAGAAWSCAQGGGGGLGLPACGGLCCLDAGAAGQRCGAWQPGRVPHGVAPSPPAPVHDSAAGCQVSDAALLACLAGSPCTLLRSPPPHHAGSTCW